MAAQAEDVDLACQAKRVAVAAALVPPAKRFGAREAAKRGTDSLRMRAARPAERADYNVKPP